MGAALDSASPSTYVIMPTIGRRDSLDTWLAERIAICENVAADDIDIEYIHRQRELKHYPTTRYDIGSKYGGYNGTGLQFKTREELEQSLVTLDRELDEL